MTGEAERSLIQRLITAGWPRPRPTPGYRWVGDQPPLATGGLFAVLPTIIERFGAPSTATSRFDLAAQLAEVGATRPVALIIGLQHGESPVDVEALEAEVAFLATSGVPVFAFTMAGRGKVHSINVAIREAERCSVDGLFLIDDDVTLGPGCIVALARAFDLTPRPCALGAIKIGRAHASSAGRILYRLKALTQPATNYPHACAMLTSLDTLAGGLATHHHSDDGQICFRLLRPDESDPLARLRLIEGAHCGHVVGAPLGATISRLNRMLHHHAICMADTPRDRARYYFRHMLFHGLWPLAPFDGTHGVGRGMAKLAIKSIYFLWFLMVAGRLALAGALQRHVDDIGWGGECGSDAAER